MGERELTEENAMREALQKKLQNPDWTEKMEHVYERIVGSDRGLTYLLDLRNPVYSEALDLAIGAIPTFDEPTTIDGLWLDRWQRSSGAFTVTRLPDDTIRIDYPTGARYVYRVARTASSSFAFTWIAEEFDLAGRRINSKRTTDRFDSYEDALFEMHRAALSEFDDLTNDY